MSIIRTRFKSKRWTKSWSGRGIALINAIEGFEHKARLKNYPTIRQMLRELLSNSPKDSFYRSLLKQSKIKSLSKRQIACIRRSYTRLIKQGHYQAHL